jgi:uncharacterized membrane protein
MRIRWRNELVHLALIAAMFVLAAATWSSAPEQIPVHWNAYGAVDRYGGKFEGLLLLPLLALAVYGLFLLVPKLDPGRANYEQFAAAYSTLRIAVTLLLAAVYALLQLTIHGYAVDISMVGPMLVGLLFIVIGNLLGKVRPNWAVGIRTPWTLSSKTSWDKTHRVGGRLFIVAGILMMLTSVLGPPWNLYFEMAMAPFLVVTSFGYSYWVWRGASDKVPPAGTLPAN